MRIPVIEPEPQYIRRDVVGGIDPLKRPVRTRLVDPPAPVVTRSLEELFPELLFPVIRR